ncbi:Zinc metalloproteinase nas-8, partial [Pseudolycoriella hygida]
MSVLSAPVDDGEGSLEDCFEEANEHHIEKRATKTGPNTLIKIPKIKNKNKWKRVVATGEILVPLVIKNRYYTRKDLAVFYKAIAEIERRTCINFVNRTTQRDYVIVRDGGKGKCGALVGRVGGPQYLSLTPPCMRKLKTCVHELIHILGFHHMHQRYDRDFFMDIKWKNIIEDSKYNFARYDNRWEAYGTGYDPWSCMHYAKDGFSKNKLNTVVPKKKKWLNVIGTQRSMSKGDVKRINRMYDCPRPHKN